MMVTHSIYRLARFLVNRKILVPCLLLAAIIFVVVTGARVETVKFPKLLGNSNENITYVRRVTDPNDFNFWVVGDVTRGTVTFEAMLELAEQDKPAFVIVLGDFVARAELIRHKLFALEMAEHVRNVPIFLVPGNHDISMDGIFRLEDFEKIYGPAQFSFTIGKNLFVFLNDILPSAQTDQCLDFLQRAVSNQERKVEKKFVFLHIPPSGLNASLECSFMPESEKFLELVNRNNVDYVFAGHHHGYAKTEKNGTTFVITGGGGTTLEGAHGKFHHMVRIAVKNGTVSDSVIATKRHLELSEDAERQIAAHLWPLISRNSLSIGVTLLLFVLVLYRLLISIYTILSSNYRISDGD
jgi:Icc-related predicted phosphoesterase